MTSNTPSKRLKGFLRLPKEVFGDDVWLMEPMAWGQAWIDLWGLANDQERTIKIRGIDLKVKRGQVAWSIASLGERWRWSREKVRRWLCEMQDRRKIIYESNKLTTLITVMDYTHYNADTALDSPTESTSDSPSNSPTESTSEPLSDLPQKVEGRTGEVEVGKAVLLAEGAVIPSEEEVAQFCRDYPGDMHRGIPAGIPEAWWSERYAYWVGTGNFPKNWRAALTFTFRSAFLSRNFKAVGGKNSQKSGGAGDGGMEAGELLQRKALLRQELMRENNPARRQEIEQELKELSQWHTT